MLELKTKKGFTIIETVLSMAFVSVLLITIAMIVVNIIAIYQKGLSIRAVNDTGRELIDEFSRSIEASPTKPVVNSCSGAFEGAGLTNCTNDKGQKLIFQQETSLATVNVSTETSITGDSKVTNPPIHGAFCTGRYSYVWNTGYVLNPGYGLNAGQNKAVVNFNVSGGGTYQVRDFKLLKIPDQARQICTGRLSKSSYGYNPGTSYNITVAKYEEPEDLLAESEDNLAIYDFQVFPPTQHAVTLHSFYSGTFILATVRGNVNIQAAGDYCNSIPDNLNTDFAYCAINKFNFAMRATGELNDSEKAERSKRYDKGEN